MKKIEELGYWDKSLNTGYDYIYIIPTKEKVNDFNSGYYLGQIGEEIKIIIKYDCGRNYNYNGSSSIQWDFEGKFKGIRMWSNGNKLTCDYGSIMIKKDKENL